MENKIEKVKTAKVSYIFEHDYTETINQMIEDRTIESQEDIEDCLKDFLFEDIAEDIEQISLQDMIVEVEVK